MTTNIQTQLLERDVSFSVSEVCGSYWLVIWGVYAIYRVVGTAPGRASVGTI